MDNMARVTTIKTEETLGKVIIESKGARAIEETTREEVSIIRETAGEEGG